MNVGEGKKAKRQKKKKKTLLRLKFVAW